MMQSDAERCRVKDAWQTTTLPVRTGVCLEDVELRSAAPDVGVVQGVIARRDCERGSRVHAAAEIMRDCMTTQSA